MLYGRGVHGGEVGGREGGLYQNILVRIFGQLPKNITLFKTKLFDFPYPIYDLTKNSIPTQSDVSIK